MSRGTATRDAWRPQTKQDRDAILLELHEVLASPHFCNSKRYPALLQYIVEKTLAGEDDLLKERTLGVEVFDRHPSFDTNGDTVVRYTASEVRKRLSLYYHELGRKPTIQISLPAGSYVPEFAHSHDEPEDPGEDEDIQAASIPDKDRVIHAGPITRQPGWTAPPNADEIVHARPSAVGAKSNSRLRLALAVIALLLIALGTRSWWRYRQLKSQTAVDIFWAPVLYDQRPVLICTGGVVFAKDRYSGVITADKDVDYPFLSQQTAFATAQISGLLGHFGATIQLAPSASTPLTELREHSVALVGGYNNRWSIRLLQPLRFHFSPEPDAIILDSMRPQSRWQRDQSVPYSSADDYAIVARYRDANTDGWVVALAGLGRNATEAAAQFATSPHYMQLLRDKVGSGFSNRNIEVVLKVSVIDGKTGAPSILAVHTW
jgi:hypothetical protein